MNGTLRTGNKFVLADKLTESITCPDDIELHESSSCLIVDGQVLVVALGKPDSTDTHGDLADSYIRVLLNAGYKYQRITLCSTDTEKRQGCHQNMAYKYSSANQKAC